MMNGIIYDFSSKLTHQAVHFSLTDPDLHKHTHSSSELISTENTHWIMIIELIFVNFHIIRRILTVGGTDNTSARTNYWLFAFK